MDGAGFSGDKLLLGPRGMHQLAIRISGDNDQSPGDRGRRLSRDGHRDRRPAADLEPAREPDLHTFDA